MDDHDHSERTENPGSPFGNTHWSVVMRAAQGDSSEAAAALEQLCREYWFPIYAFIRRSGHPADLAQDLTQEFFARLLEKRWLTSADSSKGRFRTFLLTAVTRFLANEWDRSRALKRGGGISPVSLDETDAEGRYVVNPVDEVTPERMFEQQWAETLLARVLARLRSEFDSTGRGNRFDVLKKFLTEDKGAMSYQEAASALGMTESAVKTGIFRLRSRYGEIIRDEIAQTVVSPEDVEDEIRHLLDILA